MKNLITRAYESLDNSLMSLTNKTVKAWNWTTGRTRADLANFLVGAAAVLYSAGSISATPPISLVTTPLLLLGAHAQQKQYRKIDELEQKCVENSIKSFEVEGYKSNCKFFGPVMGSISPLFFTLGANYFSDDPQKAIGFLFMGTGYMDWAVSKYVMRADYLPPRKNVFKRAADKLTEFLKAYSRKPAVVPSKVSF